MSQQEEVNTEKTVKITTSCQDCYFAKWNSGQSVKWGGGLTQIGCKLKKLNTLIDAGKAVSVTEEGQEFYVINTVCQFKRDERWAKKHENQEERVKFETDVNTTYVCLAKSPKQAARFIKKINELKSKKLPQKVIVVATWNPRVSRDVEAGQILAGKDNDIPLLLIYSLGENKTDGEHIDTVINRIDSPYYTTWEKPYSIKSNYIHKLDNVLNGQMKRVVYFDSGTFDGSTFKTDIHKMLAGNKELTLREKIIEAAGNQSNKEAVYEIA